MHTATFTPPRILQVGQRIYTDLYSQGPGIIFRINGEQRPDTIRSFGRGVLTTGGTATFDIVFKRGNITHQLPESILRGVQWDIVEGIADADEIQAALEHAAIYAEAKRVEEKATSDRRQAERVAHAASNPHLLKEIDRPQWYGARLAAENIRRELKRQFPDCVFSVRSERSSVDIYWTDGPTTKQVDEFTARHKKGYFDGMVDCYEYNPDATFADVFGGANYVSCHRDISQAGYCLAWILEGGNAEDIPADVSRNGWGNARKVSDAIHEIVGKTDLRTDAYSAALVTRYPTADKVGVIGVQFAAEAREWANIARDGGSWYFTRDVMVSIRLLGKLGWKIKLTGERQAQPDGTIHTFFEVR